MSAAGERLLKAAAEMRAMTEIPAEIAKEAREFAVEYFSCPDAGFLADAVELLILAAEQRGEQRERERWFAWLTRKHEETARD